MEVDRNGLEVLAREECLRLLGTAVVGRIAVSSRALPVVLPVNFRLVGDDVVIRTGRGTLLDAATRDAVVAFEIDEIDTFAHTGWSVVVTGVAREIALEDIDPDHRVRLARWAPGPDSRVVAISTDLVSGRRVVPGLTAPDLVPGPLTEAG